MTSRKCVNEWLRITSEDGEDVIKEATIEEDGGFVFVDN